MLSKNKIFIGVAALVFLLVASEVKAAEITAEPSMQTNQFRRIQQPLSLKVGVTIGGLALMGVELWWFVFPSSIPKKDVDNPG